MVITKIIIKNNIKIKQNSFHITVVAGARPNFIKIAPILSEIERKQAEGVDIVYRLVHTGQHYDEKMSGNFFTDLQIPKPDINLNCGSGTQAEQTAQIMVAFEKELMQNPADLVLVVGDVTSTLSCAITAKKLNIKVAHVEAGIRSFDLRMPEEINRMVTDSISDVFFTTTPKASDYLKNIGINTKDIHFVGNVMIDTLRKFENHFTKPDFFDKKNLKKDAYFVLTMHRPSNVDEKNSLKDLIEFICAEVLPLPVVFPMHPRTKKNFDFTQIPENLILVEPLGYLAFNYLVKNAKGVLTDSGGITEETTVMNIPCITLRENTERPETIHFGTNVLAGKSKELIKQCLMQIMQNNWKQGQIPELWDGQAAKRITNILIEIFKNNDNKTIASN